MVVRDVDTEGRCSEGGEFEKGSVNSRAKGFRERMTVMVPLVGTGGSKVTKLGDG